MLVLVISGRKERINKSLLVGKIYINDVLFKHKCEARGPAKMAASPQALWVKAGDDFGLILCHR